MMSEPRATTIVKVENGLRSLGQTILMIEGPNDIITAAHAAKRRCEATAGHIDAGHHDGHEPEGQHAPCGDP